MRAAERSFSPNKVLYSRNENVSNRVLLYGNRGLNLLFVPGWASTEYTWRNFIPYLSKNYIVHYFETREKPNTRYQDRNVDLSLDSMSNDLVTYANSISGLSFVAGASLGASTIINGWKNIAIKPRKLALICPNLGIRLPKLFSVWEKAPRSVLKAARPAILWGISKFSYGYDGDRVAGMLRAFRIAEIDVLLRSAKQLANLRLPSELISKIDVPALVIGTLQDEIHNLNDAIKVAKEIKTSKWETLPTFGDAHSSRSARLLELWFTPNAANSQLASDPS